jgi:hypothetical protein
MVDDYEWNLFLISLSFILPIISMIVFIVSIVLDISFVENYFVSVGVFLVTVIVMGLAIRRFHVILVSEVEEFDLIYSLSFMYIVFIFISNMVVYSDSPDFVVERSDFIVHPLVSVLTCVAMLALFMVSFKSSDY